MLVLLSGESVVIRRGRRGVLSIACLAYYREQACQLVYQLLLNVQRQIRPAANRLEQRQLSGVGLPAFHGILPRRVQEISSSDDRADTGELQAGPLQKLGEFQQGFARALRIKPQGQAFEAIPLGHPEWNGKPSLLKLDFNKLPAVEATRAKDLKFLKMQRMQRVTYRNPTRIAGIIATGSEAHRTAGG
jgi:hypothetical protein